VASGELDAGCRLFNFRTAFIRMPDADCSNLLAVLFRMLRRSRSDRMPASKKDVRSSKSIDF